MMGKSQEELASIARQVFFNAIKAEDALGVFESVQKFGDKIIRKTNHGEFFFLIKAHALDALILSLCRIYDKPSDKRNKKYTLADLKECIEKENWCNEYVLLGNIKPSEGFKKKNKEETCEIINEIWKTKDNNSAIKDLFSIRDKAIAHQDKLSSEDFQMPSYKEIDELIEWAKRFCRLFANIFQDTQLLSKTTDASKCVLPLGVASCNYRAATGAVIAEILNEELNYSSLYHIWYKSHILDSPIVPIKNLSNSPELDSVRYVGDGSIITKAGILPYHRGGDGELKFLIAKPNPVRNPVDSVPFAMARGTRRVQNELGELVDIRDADMLAYANDNPQKVEPTWQTALVEAHEELGLEASNITRLYDAGVLAYKDYGIHFYMAEVKDAESLIPAIDSEEVRWVSHDEVDKMIQDETFNKGYEKLLNAMVSQVPSQQIDSILSK